MEIELTLRSAESRIKELIQAPQYSMTYAQKRTRLLPLLEEQTAKCLSNIPAYREYLRKAGVSASGYSCYGDVPFLPVSVFKEFDLCTVPSDQVVRILKSSATTTGVPSKIYLDKPTAFRQTQALASTIMDVLGRQQRPYLVLDCNEVNAAGANLTARGAALRGFMPFASSVTYALIQNGAELELDIEAVEQFFSQHKGKPVLLSGFTYIVWMNVVRKLREKGIRFRHPEMHLFHSGGWKRLTEMRVEKEAFALGIAETFGCQPFDVRDFYGMVEQVGVVFVDCEMGNKHTPNFAEVAIRDSLTLQHVAPGELGLIEVLSALPTSYPGQALLTEDVGVFLGYDCCPCGKPGFVFRFSERVARAEVRGCGDTFAVSQQLGPGRTPMGNNAPSAPPTAVEFLVGVAPAGDSEPSALFSKLRTELSKNLAGYAALPSDVFVGLLDAASRNMVSSEYADIEGIAFVISWLRKNNLEKVLRSNFGSACAALDRPIDVDGGWLRAVPRGIVCHWVAGNIPTLALFSWALATLGKNASVVRVPVESRDVVRKLFRAVERASFEYQGHRYDGSLLLERTRVVYFPSADQHTNESMSLAADARVVWGGPEAVRAVTGYPRMEHCEDIIFGPKYSLGVIDQSTMQDAAARSEALLTFVRQAIMFEQAACSSPQVLFVEAPGMDLEELAALVEHEMAAVCRRYPKRSIEQFTACKILSSRASFGLRNEASVRASSDLTYTILVERGAQLREALQSRTLFVAAVDDLMQVIPLLSQKVQTVGVAIASAEEKRRFSEAAVVAGVARCVKPALMNIYETPWDGLLPVSRLIRWCRV